MTDREVLLESVVLIAAGSGIIGVVTMIFLRWAVMADPEIESRLEEKSLTRRGDCAVLRRWDCLGSFPGRVSMCGGTTAPYHPVLLFASRRASSHGLKSQISPWTVAGRAAAGKGHFCALGWREPDMFMAVEVLPRVSALRWRKRF
ncbi:uncharacterized protein BO95DRAFT_458445 [Aspergillus brunneoviolaceus CBS 621.78]|uniref:Uncharacterized protein n=1 Tax=Aspergillus brunneoviolaceus CBS 621.78 TaxID=1450534 RepID=A0ACD1GPF6_9EURO|nr:hypothetical protein BO95DRAFT_458445 [Aspergillus brunneoviolaceus CBS 621.78]RAH51092.1 hypothetical protein BO95DRAFT_458445 [Aspergillus brunneoviolaceus CBS 621.78]